MAIYVSIILMTSVDFLIIALLLLATQLGLRLGWLRQTGMTAGLMVGLFAAAFTQWQFSQIATLSGGDNASHIYFWLLITTLLFIIALFVDVGLSIGGWAHHRLEKFRRLEIADKIGGACMAAATTLVAVWLCSTLILRAPNSFFISQVRGSFIINSLKQTLPPAPDVFAQAGTLLDPFALPTVFAGVEPAVLAEQSAPNMSAELQKTVINAAPSVVKVTGRGCGGISTGTGFIAADNIIITNAHVIAGMHSPFVIDQAGQHTTQTIFFDPRLDLAILRTSNITAKPLPLQPEPVNNGTQGASLGYATGRLVANGATVLSRQKATGYDIYNVMPASRMIYTVNGTIDEGDSGGPLLNDRGEVIGAIFAKSSTTPHIGYALTAEQIDVSLKTALAQNQSVTNGQCGKE